MVLGYTYKRTVYSTDPISIDQYTSKQKEPNIQFTLEMFRLSDESSSGLITSWAALSDEGVLCGCLLVGMVVATVIISAIAC